MLTVVEPYDKNANINNETPNYRRTIEKICNFLLPLVILFVYTAISSGIYYVVEKDCQNTFRCPTFYLIVENATLISEPKLPTDKDETRSTLSPLLNSTEKDNFRVTDIKDSIFHNSTVQPPWYNLTYWASFQFLVVSLTTIGYGDVYPCTDAGQALIVVFSLLGIPITLITLSRLGKLIEFLLHRVWAPIYIFHRKRGNRELTDKENRLLLNKYYVPLVIAFSITTGWIFSASFYFYVMLSPFYNDDPDKPFTFFTAFYFTIISFLTIGYGDYAPKKYNLAIATFLFLLIGLSLVSICIDAIRTNFEMMFDEMIDLIDEEFADQLNDNDKQMSSNKKEAVKMLLQQKKNSNFRSKIMVSMVTKSTQKKLAQVYASKSKLNSTEVHAVCQSCDFDSQVALRVRATNVVMATKVTRDFQCQVDLTTTKTNDLNETRTYNIGSNKTIVEPDDIKKRENNIDKQSEREHSDSALSNVKGLISNDSFESFEENAIARNKNIRRFVGKLNKL